MRIKEKINWRDRLINRRYGFPATTKSEQDLAVFIEHGGAGYYFPLGTSVSETATAKAELIYQLVVAKGWKAACRDHSRELVISFEWWMNPVLWTYTTIHTIVGGAEINSDSSQANPNRQTVLVAEQDDGIRRALCWSIDHQSGFRSVPCDSTEDFARLLAQNKPRMVLLNRNLSSRLGFKSAGNIDFIRAGLPALTYSVNVDGDQMFAATPGGAQGYLVRRIKPDMLLTPILKASSRTELLTENLLLRVKYYFQELLLLEKTHDNSALTKLTSREREVLELLSKGCVDKEIAQAMGIGVWTVHGHVKNIFKRLDVRTRTEAVVRFLEK